MVGGANKCPVINDIANWGNLGNCVEVRYRDARSDRMNETRRSGNADENSVIMYLTYTPVIGGK